MIQQYNQDVKGFRKKISEQEIRFRIKAEQSCKKSERVFLFFAAGEKRGKSLERQGL